MMSKEMYEDFMGQWQKLFKTPFAVAGNEKQKEAFLKFYKDEQETFLEFVAAWQDYVKNNKPNGNSTDIGKFWQNYLESSRNLVNVLDSCRQHQHEAFFSFYQALTTEIPTKVAAAAKK
ncbi:MAG: hypothetical protein CVU52_03515 [Deltaproteobacteria bacterium HGW-Deltaproteobacteria-10]|nr:MAG: hypothetical protein CVU52_03515 [Deltaproteobacteria bacterium HGW-Deltaproteobacteria-10]